MNSSDPKVSVLMSVYNGSQYLREAIDSILTQTFSDFEFILIDDCSTDNSWEILTSYASHDSRIILIQNKENLGLTKSLNKGLKIARGKYIARQDADDVSLPLRLEKQVSCIDKKSEVGLVSCNLEMIDASGDTKFLFQVDCDSDLIAWYLLFYNYIGGHSQVLFRKKLALDLGGYCEEYRYTQDYELWSRMIKTSKFSILPEILLKHRIHSNRISNHKAAEQENYLIQRIQNNISELTNQDISNSQALNLHKFWTGSLWNSFPEIDTVSSIHWLMLKILRSFLEDRVDRQSKLSMSLHLKLLIGKQFHSWFIARLGKVKKKSDYRDITLLLFYMFFWQPKLAFREIFVRLRWKALKLRSIYSVSQ
jgi:glycosyltransferase involved in cell wall biosynthesis